MWQGVCGRQSVCVFYVVSDLQRRRESSVSQRLNIIAIFLGERVTFTGLRSRGMRGVALYWPCTGHCAIIYMQLNAK